MLAAMISLFELRNTPCGSRPARWLIALVLLALSGTAVDRVIHAHVVPPPPRAERY